MGRYYQKEQSVETRNFMERVFPAQHTRLTASLGGQRNLKKLWNSVSLILGRFSSSGLGFVTWILIARLFSPDEVGIASGVIAAVMLCVQISLLGLNSAFIAIYPEYKDDPSRMLNTAINLTLITSFFTASIFLLLSSAIFQHLNIVNKSYLYILVFISLAIFATLNTLLNHISIGIRRGEQVLARNLLFGGITIASVILIPLVTGTASSVIVVAGWAAAAIAACSLGAIQLFRTLDNYRYRLEFDGKIVKRLIRVGMVNYLLTLTERAPNWVMPIIVIELLSPTDNAYWYTLWMMAWVVYIIPISVGQNLFADLSHKLENSEESIRFSTRTSLVLSVAGAVVAIIFARFMLSFMGPEYAAAGTIPLRILAVGVIPIIFIQAYYGVCRGKFRLKEAIITGVTSGVLGLTAAIIASKQYGLVGMATVWLFTLIATGVWAFVRIQVLKKNDLKDQAVI